jgi:hypothetical protein
MPQLLDLGKLRFYFAGEWSVSTTYEINDIVKYGGNVYVYTYGLKTAGNLPTDVTYWQLMVEGVNFEGVYDNTESYQVGDGVSHGGKVYICIADTVGNTPPNATYWSQFADGIQWEGVYSSLTAYQKNDVVLYGGSAYIAKQDTTNNLPSDTAFWEPFVEGVSFKSIYNAGTVYVENDIVAYGGGLYRALGDTTGNVPTNATYWEVFQTGVNPTGDWSTATSYFPDDLVNYGGNTFKCLIAHASASFAGDLAAIPTKWEKFNSGVRYRGEWQTGSYYVVDDIVKDGVSTYVCLEDHTGGADFAVDVTANKWEFFARGATDVLPIIGAGDTGKSLTIASDGINYAWINATGSNNVFYVAPHGTDTTGSGRSLSTPFATIKYATTQCGTNAVIYVKNGTYEEQLPIVVPDTVAIIGDTQRNVLVQPETTADNGYGAGISDDGTTPNNQAQMFQLSNGSILRNMTFNGMTGWVAAAAPNADNIANSTAKGVCVALNPNAPITNKSPYVIDCTATGSGCVGAYVDGDVQASGNKSMLFHGYTVIADNGVGFWIANGAKAEIVSCFTYFCYFGYAADHGAQIRALNGNNSYGTWGAVSVGFDQSETPLTGSIKGRRIAVLNIAGTFNAGDTITGGTSGATAVLTNVQSSNGFFYVKDITGTFQVGEGLTGTNGGTADIDTNGVEDQQGFVIVADGFSEVPVPGRSIQFAGDSIAYVIQSVSGTYVDATSEVIMILAQEKATGSADNTAITIRAGFSQIRLTGHDFLKIGTGGVTTTNYPGDPTQLPAQGNEIQETYPARVYYVSTDQDGNFRVGEYFRIEQATGTATLNANAFDLAGLTSLQLGSIGAQLGETINEFSSDVTLSGSSNTAVPTENAVKTYVDAAVVSGANSPNSVVMVTGNVTATLGNIYASTGAHTITLPASPAAGDTLIVLDASGTSSTGNITIARNSNNITGAADDLLLDVDNASIKLVYINSTYGWGVV